MGCPYRDSGSLAVCHLASGLCQIGEYSVYFYLEGLITLHQKDSIVVDCHGVGYQVFVSHPEAYELGSVSKVYTSFYVREDEQFLVGFKTFEEKQLFNKLISVKGIGPKTAIAALGGTTPDKLIDAVDRSDILFLRKLPGIGPKAANQIILDLRGKLAYANSTKTGDKNFDEALEALKSFGFKQAEIIQACSKITERGLTTEEYLKKALNLIGRK